MGNGTNVASPGSLRVRLESVLEAYRDALRTGESELQEAMLAYEQALWSSQHCRAA